MKVIDSIENKLIVQLNSIISDPVQGKELKQNFLETNEDWKNIRNDSLSQPERDHIMKLPGTLHPFIDVRVLMPRYAL